MTCKVTGKRCKWSWCCAPPDADDESDYFCGEAYCMDCYESRDFNLEEFEEDNE